MEGHPPPAQATLHLDGKPGSTTAARHHAEGFLGRLNPPLPPALVQDAVLVISELVSNAVRHAPGPCALDLLRQDQDLLIAVTDTSPVAPVPRDPDLLAGNGGFGMRLLERLGDETTVRTHRDGKTVTVLLRGAPR